MFTAENAEGAEEGKELGLKVTNAVAALRAGNDGAFWRRATWALVVGVAAVRVMFLVFVSPYELTGDEAHYWEWSRRPSLSYYSKGPGVAWTIWASTRVFGDAEWAVRLPSVVFGAVGALAVAGLARRAVHESEKRKAKSENEDGAGWTERVGFVAAGMFCLIPAYQAIGLLMTIDGAYVACWAVAALLGWMGIVEGKRWAVVACAAVLGVGFLFKYTILLLVAGLVGAMVWMRKDAASRLRGESRHTATNSPTSPQGCHAGLTQVAASRLTWVWVIASVLVFLTAISPVIVWNWQHDWPTVKHLLGHIGARGGDLAGEAKKAWRYDPMWTLEFTGTQIGLIGPLLVMMVMGTRGDQPQRTQRAQRDSKDDDQKLSFDCVSVFSVSSVVKAFCLWCAAPIVVFYFVTSFATDVEGNWPIAGYVTLLPLAAVVVVREVERLRGAARKRSVVRGVWHGAIVYGVIAGVGMLSLVWLARLPGVGGVLPAYRLTGKRAIAERVEAVLREHPGAFLVASRYDTASLLAYYLPGHPSVRSATSVMGGRRSSYDFFGDTRLDDPALLGRDAVLVGGGEKKWSRALAFDEVRTIEEEGEGRPAVRVGLGYRGLAEGGARE